MTYNIKSLRWDVAALVRVIRRLRPDVLVLQEAPTLPGWRARCAALARRCGLLYLAGGREAGGNLLLVTPRVAVEELVVDRTPEPWRDPIRGLIHATLRVGGSRLGLIGTHFGLRRAGRANQLSYLIRALRELSGLPTLLLADMNELPDGPTWQALATAGLADPGAEGAGGGFGGATFPSGSPSKRIDAILATAEVDVKEYRVPDEPEIRTDLMRATDHLPVLATIGI